MSRLYVIYDRVAEESSPPFMARTDGVAVRMYLQSIQQNKLDIQDYWLYKIGCFNCEDMTLIAKDKPLRVKVSDGSVEAESELDFEDEAHG